VNRAAGGAITVLVGTVLLRLTLTGTYRRYVRVGMGPFLLVAGAVVIVLGMATLVRALRDRERDGGTGAEAYEGHEGDEGHGHGHDDRVGWLLLAPVAALLLVAPPALGSYSVDRGAAVDVRAGDSTFATLEPGRGPVPMTLLEYNQRAFDHDGATFNGVPVQLTGFVADAEAPFRVVRYQIACCAVDAAPIAVRVVGTTGASPPRDQWVTITGTFQPAATGGDEIPALAATSVVEIPAPDDPYE